MDFQVIGQPSLVTENSVAFRALKLRTIFFFFNFIVLNSHMSSLLSNRNKCGLTNIAIESPVCDRICTTSWCSVLNLLSHSEHFCCSSVECTILSCDVKNFVCVNSFVHWLHLCTLPLLWIFIWAIYRDFRPNLRSHGTHSKGFSPVCLCLCQMRLIFWTYDLSHKSHLYGRSSVCQRIWVL